MRARNARELDPRPVLSRRAFLAAAGGGIASVALAACGEPAPETSTTTAVPDYILATDPEVADAEAARTWTGREVAVALVAGEALSARWGLIQGYSTELGLGALGPTLRASAGDRLVVDVDNQLPADTSVHWHGLRLRNDMDGSPPYTQRPIASGDTFRYAFIAPDPGTYWYHSHSGLQADRALFGALVVEDPADVTGADLDVVVVIDDWLAGIATPEEVFAALDGDSSGHAHGSSGIGSADGGAAARLVGAGTGASEVLGGPSQHIAYPEHLINGRAVDDPDRIEVPAGGRVRFRFINAAAETPYRVALGGHRMTVIAADGFDTVPFDTDAVLLAPAQRLDVLVTVDSGAWPLVAGVEGRDGAGLAVVRTRDTVAETPTGRAATRIPELAGRLATDADLRPAARVALQERDPDQLWRIELRRAGTRYAWAIAGEDAGRMLPRLGQRVRIEMTNTSDMWHPMHLHGHTFAVVEHGGLRRDTAIVLPGRTLTVDTDADNPGQWMLHCHNAYHFEAGMSAGFNYVR